MAVIILNHLSTNSLHECHPSASKAPFWRPRRAWGGGLNWAPTGRAALNNRMTRCTKTEGLMQADADLYNNCCICCEHCLSSTDKHCCDPCAENHRLADFGAIYIYIIDFSEFYSQLS